MPAGVWGECAYDRLVEQREPLDGIAAAHAHLGRPVPLPSAALTLYAGLRAPPERGLPEASAYGRYAYRMAPLDEAEVELRPVRELAREQEGLHLRLTGQGPWPLEQLVALADSTR